jgi:hypothetical protein
MWPKKCILVILDNHNKRTVNHQSVQLNHTEVTLNVIYLLQIIRRDFPVRSAECGGAHITGKRSLGATQVHQNVSHASTNGNHTSDSEDSHSCGECC